MSHNQVILLLGTNLGNKKSNLKTAGAHISKRIGSILKKSEILETEPLGFDSDHKFLNQTLLVNTEFSPILLLKEIKSIERTMGRIYTQNKSQVKYEDRIIDIDILNFNNLKFESTLLKIPHHQIQTRNFVKMLLRF